MEEPNYEVRRSSIKTQSTTLINSFTIAILETEEATPRSTNQTNSALQLLQWVSIRSHFNKIILLNRNKKYTVQCTKPALTNIYHLDFSADQNTISRPKAGNIKLKNVNRSHHTHFLSMYQYTLQFLKAEDAPTSAKQRLKVNTNPTKAWHNLPTMS